MFASNFSAQSGYAIQARLFTKRIQAAGHILNVLELANGTRLPYEVDGIQVVPVGLHPLGDDVFVNYFERFRAHATITLVDAWGMKPDIMRNLNWFPLAPIDTRPVAPAVADSLKACRRPIAYSRYAVEELRKIGLSAYYWPHAVDPQVWRPGDKQAARAKIGLKSDVFAVAFVGVNDSTPSRKGIPELLMAWQIFHDQYPNSVLYLHTALHGNLGIASNGGVRVDQLVKTLNIEPGSVLLPDQHQYRTGLPAARLVEWAQAADVFVLPSRGEGFGLPLLEFQRVGCPVITTEFAAQAELCFGGWKIGGEPEWGWMSAFVMKPGIADLVEALEAAREDRNSPTRRLQAIEGAREYDIDWVMHKYALPVLRLISEEILDSIRVA